VHIIVSFPAGGPTDIVARLMAQWLSERLGQQFVVENRPGAASNIGTEAALKAPPDGYTLLQVTSTNAVNVTFYENLNFNFATDIAPVAGIIRVPFVMELNRLVPAKTVPEWPGTGDVRCLNEFASTHSIRRVACTGSDDRDALGSAARPADSG
jgi:tripartite-type tricarboxylate transporter receptor subunit TctC